MYMYVYMHVLLFLADSSIDPRVTFKLITTLDGQFCSRVKVNATVDH